MGLGQYYVPVYYYLKFEKHKVLHFYLLAYSSNKRTKSNQEKCWCNLTDNILKLILMAVIL